VQPFGYRGTAKIYLETVLQSRRVMLVPYFFTPRPQHEDGKITSTGWMLGHNSHHKPRGQGGGRGPMEIFQEFTGGKIVAYRL
jgi:hypothetical protein